MSSEWNVPPVKYRGKWQRETRASLLQIYEQRWAAFMQEAGKPREECDQGRISFIFREIRAIEQEFSARGLYPSKEPGEHGEALLTLGRMIPLVVASFGEGSWCRACWADRPTGVHERVLFTNELLLESIAPPQCIQCERILVPFQKADVVQHKGSLDLHRFTYGPASPLYGQVQALHWRGRWYLDLEELQEDAAAPVLLSTKHFHHMLPASHFLHVFNQRVIKDA